MADKMLIDGLIKFCDEKSENIKLKAEPQVFVEIAESLKLLKWYQQGMEDVPDESGVLPKDVYRAGYIKAIDEFAEKIKKKGIEDNWNCNDFYGDSCGVTSCEECENDFLREIDEMAEQLKAGAENEDNC